MEMELKQKVALKNGLMLCLLDASRKIAGDRWFVSILAKIEIPVDEKIVDTNGVEIPVEDLRALIGERVEFEKKMERNFISEDRKDETVSEIIRTFMADIVPYLSDEKFAPKYLVKIFKEARMQRGWYQ